MASAGARAYNGGLGRCPQRGPGAEPLIRGRSPPEAEKLFAFRCALEAANLPVFSLYCRLSKSFKFSIRQWQWGIDLGVIWVGVEGVHDLSWHQNDLKGRSHLFRVLSSVLRNTIVRDFSIHFLQACGPMKLVNILDISIATYKSLRLCLSRPPYTCAFCFFCWKFSSCALGTRDAESEWPWRAGVNK